MNIIKKSAEAEDISTFDANGRSGEGPATDGGDIRHSDNDSSPSLPESSSHTDDTSLSQGLSSLDLEVYSENDADSEDRLYIGGLERLDEEGKVSILAGIFSSLKAFDVRWTLKKCKWDVNRAIDDLMTESFLEESGRRHRGIEAFSESDLTLRPRKGKGKKRKDRTLNTQVGGSSSESPVGSPHVSKWDNGKQDVEFISTRMGVPAQQVSSIYHNKGASVRDTISAIVDAHLALELDLDDPVIQSKTIDLAHEFPTVAASNLEAIIQITYPSDAYAHELAKALTPPKGDNNNIEIEIRHAPLQLNQEHTPSMPKTYNALYADEVNLELSAAKAAKYAQERDTAFQKASVLHRKGKSDYLMGGAAAYYSQQGRDADALARRAQSEAADARVAAQSTRFELDLHGCNVNDAKRITKERVTAWWQELRLGRAGSTANIGSSSHLKVVTGRGNHSEGRSGKLGPAVGKMLIRDGWKIEVTPGFLMVTGVAQKK